MRPKQRHILTMPALAEPCYCGSGLTFNECCAGRLPGTDIGKKTREDRAAANWEAMLLSSRADVSQYTIWHKSHTAPAVVAGATEILPLLRIDVEALASYVDEMMVAYRRLERQAELLPVLERLRQNIHHPRWQRKIGHLETILPLVDGDIARARAEFKKLEPITETEDDVEILQAYIDVCRDEITPTRQLALCDQILRHTRSLGDGLQYNGLKANTYAALGEIAEAEKVLALAISDARRREEQEPFSPRQAHFFAGLLTEHGLFGDRRSALEEALYRYKSLIADDETWTVKGRAMLYRDMGECLRYMGEWAKAEQAYRDALGFEESGIARVHLSECLGRQERLDEAESIFDRIETGKLDSAEKVDHAYTAAMLAARRGSKEQIDRALDLLRSAKTSAPYFEERRLNLIIELQNAAASNAAPARMNSILERFLKPLRIVSRYVLLQPNVMGFGLNINAIIEDADKAAAGTKEHSE